MRSGVSSHQQRVRAAFSDTTNRRCLSTRAIGMLLRFLQATQQDATVFGALVRDAEVQT